MKPSFTTTVALGAGGVAALLIGACTALLGNDFEIETTPSSSGNGGDGASVTTGGGGAAAGGGGSGAGEPVPPYECHWKFPAHTVVESLEPAPSDDRWSRAPRAVRVDNEMRVAIVREYGGTTSELELYTLADGKNERSTSQGRELYDMARLNNTQVAVLYSIGTAGTPPYISLWMRVVNDNDGNGSNGVDERLTATSALVDVDSDLAAAFAPLTPPASGVDYFASYAVTSGEYYEYYGRRDGAAAVVPTLISESGGPALTEDDVRPFEMIHFDGTSYVFVGDPGAPLGPRQFALNDSVTGAVAARSLGSPSQILMAGLVKPSATANLAGADVGTSPGDPLILFADEIEGSNLGTFVIDELAPAAQYASLGELPIGDAFMGWIDDILVLLGSKSTDVTSMSFAFFDSLSRERGAGTLPFTATLGPTEERVAIDRLAVVARDEFFHTIGGDLHVVWTEDHRDTNNPGTTFQVMYYDQLSCYPQAQ